MTKEQTNVKIEFRELPVVDRVVKRVNLDERTVEHVISTPTLDRGQDVVDVAGWELDEYMRNPIVLANHNRDLESVIGRSKTVDKRAKALTAVTEFHDVGLGAMAFDLVRTGMVKAWSVGFRGNESHGIRQGAKDKCPTCVKAVKAILAGRDPEDIWIHGRHFTKQTLFEYSLVAIPANPDAVVEAIAKGFVTEESSRVFFRNNDGGAHLEAVAAKLEVLVDTVKNFGSTLASVQEVVGKLDVFDKALAKLDPKRTVQVTKTDDGESTSDTPAAAAPDKAKESTDEETASPVKVSAECRDVVADTEIALRRLSRGLAVKTAAKKE